MHLLTYYINQVLLMTSLFVLMTFDVNHVIVIDECWRIDPEGRHFEHCYF